MIIRSTCESKYRFYRIHKKLFHPRMLDLIDPFSLYTLIFLKKINMTKEEYQTLRDLKVTYILENMDGFGI